ncbi:hypothetical protein BMS_0309 [Halobacteriovorax marinus SJ]|uniref:Cobalamin-independent methionine synthase MetE C-terminal/archaeal domain-containing protein n=2 Tax=Halobacteriovorax marinus TaxID=97084 RepID=E1X3D9_HALMS|nr:hypothetical protein BMS_0309 [Halobacteriovorax marinus SJ]
MAMMDKLLPITGIGSLPHTDIESAVNFSLKFDIPFLPELTKIESSLKIHTIEDFKCFDFFIQKVKEVGTFKTQCFHDSKREFMKREIHFIDDPQMKMKSHASPIALHCCNKVTMEYITSNNITHLSFDANLIEEPKEFINELLARGITPIVGVVSTHDESISLCHNFEYWKPVLRDNVLNCWLAPACGLSRYTEEEAEEVLELLQETRRELLRAIS